MKRLLFFALVSSQLLLACSRPSYSAAEQDLVRSIYSSQIQLSDQFDLALQDLSREYFVLSQEYQSMGRNDLARLAEQRARSLHQRHQRVQALRDDTSRRLAQFNATGTLTVPAAAAEAQPAQAAAGQGQAMQPPTGVASQTMVAPHPGANPAAATGPELTPAQATMPGAPVPPAPARQPLQDNPAPAAQPQPSAGGQAPAAQPQPPPTPPPVPPNPTPTPTPIPPAPNPPPTPPPIPPNPTPAPGPAF